MSAVLFDVAGPRAKRRQLIGTIIVSVVLLALLGAVLWKLWVEEQITPDQWEFLTVPSILEALGEGLLATLSAAAAAIVLAVGFGAIFAAGRLSDHAVVRYPSIVVIEFFRAVPLLLLILFIFLAYGSTLGRYWSLVIGLTLYNGAVLAEIFRAGIQAVPKGQSEAAYAIGLRKNQVMRLILGPQALTTMLPAIISQCVVALKDTALGYVIASPEITNVARRVFISPTYNNPLAVGLFLAGVFIVINYSLSKVAQWLEARQRRSGRPVVVNIDPGGGTAGAGA